jgi:nitrite reductase/ring-hydroxylating ferredoxin subunit
MPFVKVYSLSQLPPGDVTEVMTAGIPIALCNIDGEILALSGICPHHGGPLGQGAINGENVVCPWHAWEFNCRTGRNDYNPDLRIPTYPARLDGDDILVDSGA